MPYTFYPLRKLPIIANISFYTIYLRVIILQTSGFHQSIAHSFVILETKFHVNDITPSVTYKQLVHVIYHLSATMIYYHLYISPYLD